MGIRFSGCNCCCIYFTDSFDRPALAADGVNRDGSDRYEFTSGDWEVNVASGRLLCNTADSPIHFYNDSALKSFQVSADFRFHNIGDYVSVLYDTTDEEAKIEWTNAYEKTLTIGTSSNVIAHTASSGKIFMSLFTMSGFHSHTGLAYPWNSITGSKVAVGIDAFQWGSDCFSSYVLSTGYTKYGLQASDGVVIDNLLVTYSKEECASYIEMGCGAVCDPDPLPASVVIEFSDIPNGYSRCRSQPTVDWDNAIDSCESTFESTRLGCDSAHTSGTWDWCNCIQSAVSDYWTCTCNVYDSNTSCVISCPGSMMNAVFVLDKVTAAQQTPCTHCLYELEVTYPDYWAHDYVDPDESSGQPCSSLVTGTSTTFSAVMRISYYDNDTGETEIDLIYNTPFLPQFNFYASSISGINFCAGDWNTGTGPDSEFGITLYNRNLYGIALGGSVTCNLETENNDYPYCYDAVKQVSLSPDCGAHNNSHVPNPECIPDSSAGGTVNMRGTV
jgi:hypothetical protein